MPPRAKQLHDNTWLMWDLVLCLADYGESRLLKREGDIEKPNRMKEP